MIKAIANDSKVRIDKIVANYEQLKKENAYAKTIIQDLLPYAKTEKHDKQDLQSIERFCETIERAEDFLKE